MNTTSAGSPTNSMKLYRCIDNENSDTILELGKIYRGHTTDKHAFIIIYDEYNIIGSYYKERFEEVTGDIYLVCAVDIDVKTDHTIADPVMSYYSNEIVHSLDKAKDLATKLQTDIDKTGDVKDCMAAIFVLHSYYEDKPFFVKVGQFAQDNNE